MKKVLFLAVVAAALAFALETFAPVSAAACGCCGGGGGAGGGQGWSAGTGAKKCGCCGGCGAPARSDGWKAGNNGGGSCKGGCCGGCGGCQGKASRVRGGSPCKGGCCGGCGCKGGNCGAQTGGAAVDKDLVQLEAANTEAVSRAKSNEVGILVYAGAGEVRNADIKALVDSGKLVAFRATSTEGTGIEDETAEKAGDGFRSNVFESSIYDLKRALDMKSNEFCLCDWDGNKLASSTNVASIATKAKDVADLREKLVKKADKAFEAAQKAADAGDYAKAKKELLKLAKTGFVGTSREKDLLAKANEELSGKEVASR